MRIDVDNNSSTYFKDQPAPSILYKCTSPITAIILTTRDPDLGNPEYNPSMYDCCLFAFIYKTTEVADPLKKQVHRS